MLATRAARSVALRAALFRGVPCLRTTVATYGSASTRALCGASLLLSPAASNSYSGTSSALFVQRRTQYMPVAGKRDQEAFLSQFDPMEVLGLEDDCNVEDIDTAFEHMKSKYAANGPAPDAKMLDRVFRAHEILKDPDSPYYLRAHSSQTDRQRLQFQLLPKSKRKLIEFQVGILMCVLFVAAALFARMCLQPMRRSLRAATR